MARPNEIAADARALYGPPSVRPAAGAMGDGALWVDPGDSQSLWQVQSGNWRQIALPPADDDSSIPTGVPVLRGPYVVNYTDIPHDGDTRTLWTPQVGDVLLSIFSDYQTAIDLDHGSVDIGTSAVPYVIDANDTFSGLGSSVFLPPYVFHATDAVVVRLRNPGGAPDPTRGHGELYALVARAVAP